jgi:hypothetical protein
VSSDPLGIALRVASAMEACGLRYLVGGSLASSLGGEPRSTLDVDIVVSMKETDIACLLNALGPEFYVDETAVQRAIQRRSSVNLIHQATAIKVDLFLAGGTPLDEQQLDRRQRVHVGPGPQDSLYFHTPEDILLQKLRWYRLSGEQSDRQWRDALGIVLVQAGRLDTDYLRRYAETLGVRDLVDWVLSASSSPP